MRSHDDYGWFFFPHWIKRYGPLQLVAMPLLDRLGMHYFTLYGMLNAMLGGAATLGMIVMRKTLHADALQISAVATIGSVSLLLGVFGSQLVQGRDKRPFVLWMGLACRATFLLFLFCYGAWTFVAINAVFSILNALLMPAIFGLWQSGISPESRSRLWGVAAMLTSLVSMAAAYATGFLLHLNPDSFRWIFALTGLLGMFSIVVLVRMPQRHALPSAEAPPSRNFHQLVILPVLTFFRLLRSDRKFAYFEGAYFLYGIALMLTFPVLPIYMVDRVHMDYEQAGIALGLLAQVGVVALSTYWGKLMDRVGPTVSSAYIFGLLVLFPAVLLAGPIQAQLGIPLVWGVYLSHIILSAGMAGVNVTWSLAPISFAGEQDSSSYSGAHVTLTGIRGSFAPILGALGLKYFGFEPVFILSAAFFLLAALGMIALALRYPDLRHGARKSMPAA